MDINTLLKNEVNELDNRTGLSKLLKKHGRLHITGSYVYDLMAWKDYDLVLELPLLETSSVDKIVNEIETTICPDKLNIFDNTKKENRNRPSGYWIGIYIDSWKIDLWLMDSLNAGKEVENTAKFSTLLKDINKNELIAIKQELSKDKDYHAKFSSVDLYNSYLYGNVRSAEEFYKWLFKKTRISKFS